MAATDIVLGSFDSLWHYGLHPPPPPSTFPHETLSVGLLTCLQSLFALLDEDGDDRLSLRELRSLLARLGFSSNENDLLCLLQPIISPNLYRRTSSSPDLPTLDFSQFTSLYCSLFAASQNDTSHDAVHDTGDDELRDAFRIYDMNNDGFISATELAAVLAELKLLPAMEGDNWGREAHVARCQLYIDCVDLDGNGMVDLEEFKAMMMTSGYGCPVRPRPARAPEVPIMTTS